MENLIRVENATSPNSDMDSNDTTCYGESMNYIPTVAEYGEALGGYGTAFVTIGSVTTILLYLLFFQQAWFTLKNSHKVYRRHIYWLISIYPFVTLMSTVAVIVPRSHQLCTAIKVVYMSIGAGHFADLTLLMYGSENKMMYELRDSSLKLNVMPLCCVFPCLPTPPISRLRLSLVKWLIWQMKWTQALYYIILYILNISIQNSDGTCDDGHSVLSPLDCCPLIHPLNIQVSYFQVNPRVSFLWLTSLNFASFLSGVYALNVMGALSEVKLLRFRYKAKCLAVKMLILTIKMQGFIFDLLGLFGAFPCLGPMITPVVFQNTLENSVFLIEMVIFGLFSYVMYRLPEFNEFEEPAIPTTETKDVEEGGRSSIIQVTEVQDQIRKQEEGQHGPTRTDTRSDEQTKAVPGPVSWSGEVIIHTGLGSTEDTEVVYRSGEVNLSNSKFSQEARIDRGSDGSESAYVSNASSNSSNNGSQDLDKDGAVGQTLRGFKDVEIFI